MMTGSRTLGPGGAGAPHQRFGKTWLATELIHRCLGYRYRDLGPFRAIRTDGSQLGVRDRDYG
jgi:hypothetical protein